MDMHRSPGIVAAPESWKYPTLSAALAAFQAALPGIVKANTAEIPTKQGGRYKYTYADLADMSLVVMPALGEMGLCFTAFPTVVGERFGLSYSLQHESGEHLDGFYPLPDPLRSGAQDLGSAITYARRYVLGSVVGVAPDEDDDGARAQQAYDRSREQQRRSERPAGRPQEPPQPEATQEVPEYVVVRGMIGDWVKGEYLPDHLEKGYTDVARAFHALYGTELGLETSVHRLGAVLRTLQEKGLAGLMPSVTEPGPAVEEEASVAE